MTYSIKFKFKFIRPFLIRAKGSKGTACRCAHPPSARMRKGRMNLNSNFIE